jgi:hypothetical protein
MCFVSCFTVSGVLTNIKHWLFIKVTRVDRPHPHTIKSRLMDIDSPTDFDDIRSFLYSPRRLGQMSVRRNS